MSANDYCVSTSGKLKYKFMEHGGSVVEGRPGYLFYNFQIIAEVLSLPLQKGLYNDIAR